MNTNQLKTTLSTLLANLPTILTAAHILVQGNARASETLDKITKGIEVAKAIQQATRS